MKWFAIEDTKAEAFNKPFPAPTVGAALRALENSLEEDELTRRNAHDYQLYELGEFDEVTGKLTGLPTPKHICGVAELLRDEAPASPNVASLAGA